MQQKMEIPDLRKLDEGIGDKGSEFADQKIDVIVLRTLHKS